MDRCGLHVRLPLAAQRSGDLQGEPHETGEAIPFWKPVDAVPYDEMWEDDRHWLPHMLAGSGFTAYFTFDGERMLTKEVELHEEACRP